MSLIARRRHTHHRRIDLRLPNRRFKTWAAWVVATAAVLVVLLGAGLVFTADFGLRAAAAQSTGTAPGATVTTHLETFPNPVHNSGFTVAPACRTTTQPCDWSKPSTWRSGSVPRSGDRVVVDGNVEIGDRQAVARSVGVYPGGTLTFAPNARTLLTTADLVVFDGGALNVGTRGAPVNAGAEIVFRDLAFDSGDGSQHLRGLVALGGTIRIHGRTLSDTYLRTALEPTQGASTITTAQSMKDAGWRVGDTVTIPTSEQCRNASSGCGSQTEDRRITSISGDGLTATLDNPLTYDHPGARNLRGELDFMPHVINKTRNVVFRSENPNGVRGHLLFHGRSDVDMRYAEVASMGRTNIQNLGPSNQKGRYPLHAHHLIGPLTPQANGYQFTLVGNVIDFGGENVTQGRKWGIALHGSHYGLIEGNVVDRASGAAIVTESGSEMGNVLDSNFVVRVVGGNSVRTVDRDPSDQTKSGRAGVGYWFNGGGRNTFRANIAADVADCVYCFGFKFDNVRTGDVLFPTSQGSDPHADGGEIVDGNDIGLNDFVDNEAYAVSSGLTIWWQCMYGETPRSGCSSHLDSFRVWHHHRWGYYGYETSAMTLDSFVVRGDPDVLSNRYESVSGLEFGDYGQYDLVIANPDIQNVRTGIRMPTFRGERGSTGADAGVTVVEGGYLVATEGIAVWAPASVNGSPDVLSPQRSVVRNVRFDYPSVGSSGDEPGHIVMSDRSILLDANKTNFDVRNDVVVENYNQAPGVDGDDFHIVPDYHGPGRCDSAVAVCGSELTSQYGDIRKGHVFALAGGGSEPPVDPPPTGVNLVNNGDFDADTESWGSWSLDYNHQVSVDSGELRFEHLNQSGRNFSQLYQRIGPVAADRSYRLRFDVRSDQDDGSVYALIQQVGAPWHRLTNVEPIAVNRGSQQVEVLLTADASYDDVTIMLELKGDNQTIWIDNVELVEGG